MQVIHQCGGAGPPLLPAASAFYVMESENDEWSWERWVGQEVWASLQSRPHFLTSLSITTPLGSRFQLLQEGQWKTLSWFFLLYKLFLCLLWIFGSAWQQMNRWQTAALRQPELLAAQWLCALLRHTDSKQDTFCTFDICWSPKWKCWYISI